MSLSIRGYTDKENPGEWKNIGDFTEAKLWKEKCYRFTTMEGIPNVPRRERGKYVLGNSMAIIDGHISERSNFSIHMEFADPIEAERLYELIRAGRITPQISYENEQVKRSRYSDYKKTVARVRNIRRI